MSKHLTILVPKDSFRDSWETTGDRLKTWDFSNFWDAKKKFRVMIAHGSSKANDLLTFNDSR